MPRMQLSPVQTGGGRSGAAPSQLAGYLSHFYLAEDPFSLTANPRFMYLGGSHSDALAAFSLGVSERRGLIVVAGEVGTGKTALARFLFETAARSTCVALVPHYTPTFEDILRRALRQFWGGEAAA